MPFFAPCTTVAMPNCQLPPWPPAPICAPPLPQSMKRCSAQLLMRYPSTLALLTQPTAASERPASCKCECECVTDDRLRPSSGRSVLHGDMQTNHQSGCCLAVTCSAATVSRGAPLVRHTRHSHWVGVGAAVQQRCQEARPWCRWHSQQLHLEAGS